MQHKVTLRRAKSPAKFQPLPWPGHRWCAAKQLYTHFQGVHTSAAVPQVDGPQRILRLCSFSDIKTYQNISKHKNCIELLSWGISAKTCQNRIKCGWRDVVLSNVSHVRCTELLEQRCERLICDLSERRGEQDASCEETHFGCAWGEFTCPDISYIWPFIDKLANNLQSTTLFHRFQNLVNSHFQSSTVALLANLQGRCWKMLQDITTIQICRRHSHVHRVTRRLFSLVATAPAVCSQLAHKMAQSFGLWIPFQHISTITW